MYIKRAFRELVYMVEYIMVWGAYEVMNYDSKALYEKYKKKNYVRHCGERKAMLFPFSVTNNI